jgi:hypothetical protein
MTASELHAIKGVFHKHHVDILCFTDLCNRCSTGIQDEHKRALTQRASARHKVLELCCERPVRVSGKVQTNEML